jgi:hypothetical protein
MILSVVIVSVYVGVALAAYGFDASIWQKDSFTDSVAQCWKSKNVQFVVIGAINRSGTCRSLRLINKRARVCVYS